MHRIIKVFMGLLLSLPLLINAEIYRWKDDAGKLHYSDQPQEEAMQIRLNAGESYYQVKKIYDGDTLQLTNSKKIRLLGVNTPEVESRYKLSEVGGEKAKQWLINTLSDKKIRLKTDIEKVDKYGRSLAHIFTNDGLHVNSELLRQGLAVLSIYPPNIKYSKQLIAAQKEAEKAKRGLWREEAYHLLPIEELNKNNYKGWKRLTGQVKKVHTARKFVYLKFSSKFEVKILKTASSLFPDLTNYEGKELEIRGWVSRRGKRYSLLVRHPSAIRVIN